MWNLSTASMYTGGETKSQFCKPLIHHVESMVNVQDCQAVILMEELVLVVDRMCLYPFLEL